MIVAIVLLILLTKEIYHYNKLDGQKKIKSQIKVENASGTTKSINTQEGLTYQIMKTTYISNHESIVCMKA